MSKVEYNSLLLRISERLDDINALNRILFICREKLAGEDIHDSLSMLIKLEQKGFLGVDELQEVKDILKAVEEWGLREEIIKFESMRGEYKELIERVIGVLEDLNDLERLMSTVYRVRRIPEERKNDIHDLRSLFQVLEDMNFLGIDRLGILREILTELKNHELLTELAEFQKRRVEYETYEKRKGNSNLNNFRRGSAVQNPFATTFCCFNSLFISGKILNSSNNCSPKTPMANSHPPAIFVLGYANKASNIAVVIMKQWHIKCTLTIHVIAVVFIGKENYFT